MDLIYKIIKNEPWLRDADGNCVSRSWVKNRLRITRHIQRKLVSFLLYDVTVDNSIYIHMVWVDKRCRGEGHGKSLIGSLKDLYPNVKLFYAYANPMGQKLLQGCGFDIGNIPYRECILRKG